MSDVNFDCPECDQNLDAPSDMAGETIECPTCQNSIGIPAPQRTAPSRQKRVVLKKSPAKSRALSSAQRTAPSAAPESNPSDPGDNASEKRRLGALLLCLFLGGLGVHRFYVGKVGTGIVQILTLAGFCGIWVTIDLIMIICGSFKDKQGLPLKNW